MNRIGSDDIKPPKMSRVQSQGVLPSNPAVYSSEYYNKLMKKFQKED